jgi:competence protein ComFC
MWMIHTSLQKITTLLGSIFFPSYCYLCKKEGASLCVTCLTKRARAYDTPSLCITPLYSFKDPAIKKIIHAIKYFHRKDLISPLAEILAKEIALHDSSFSLVIPIPMPRVRKYIRGYNQAEELAQRLSKELDIPCAHDILIRNKKLNKKRQVTTHSRAERLQNQHNAFVVQKEVQGVSIILVDDVTTTGATLLEARRVLLLAGATQVQAYTLAH